MYTHRARDNIRDVFYTQSYKLYQPCVTPAKPQTQKLGIEASGVLYTPLTAPLSAVCDHKWQEEQVLVHCQL